MKYVIRFWATLISFIFVMCASIITIVLAFVSTAILFVSALIATPFFFFSPHAAALLDRVTEIVVSPLRLSGSTIGELWSQLWRVATGQESGTKPEERVKRIAAVAIRLALTAICLTVIGLLPVSSYWEELAYVLTIAVLVIVWAIFVGLTASNDKAEITAGTVIGLAITAAAITAIAISPIKGGWVKLADALTGVGLLIVWIYVIGVFWMD